ncbi:hypothetical protein ACH5RR_013353, partial [Cinchona calisaya]
NHEASLENISRSSPNERAILASHNKTPTNNTINPSSSSSCKASASHARLLLEFTPQKPSTTSQSAWPNIAALFLNKWSVPDDSTVKQDQRQRVSVLKDELFKYSGDAESIETVLEEKGAPLFRTYYDGSAVVELLKVFNWRRKQLDHGASMTTEEYAKGITLAGRLKDVDLAADLFAEAANKKTEGNLFV